MTPDQLESDQLEGDDQLEVPEEAPEASLADDAAADEELLAESNDEQATEPLNLETTIEAPSACERHVTVVIAREDIDRYYDEAFSEMMPTATVPGFRPGRAPRKLVESRFRKEITEQVKGSLLMDSMGQVSEDQSFTPISEPEFDFDAVEIPDEGPLTFEFNLEVRPEFDMPEWKGLTVRRPVKEHSEKEIDQRLERMLAQYGQLVPYDGKAEEGDYLILNIRATHAGETVSSSEEQLVRIRARLSFRDGNLDGFAKLMTGVEAGETRSGEVELTADAPNEALRGEKLQVTFNVLEVKKLEMPELTPQFLDEMGGFESEEALRQAVRSDLERQLDFQRQQQARRQITAALTAAANWELPPTLLHRQSARELERAVLELRRSGFSDTEIRARENELRQHSAAATETALKEHFILERIAEEEEIEVDEIDFDKEVTLIASQSAESPRRVRAQLEKRGLMDVLRNQIVERKVIGLVQEHAKFQDEPLAESDREDVEAIDLAAGGGDEESTIPEVKSPEAKQGGTEPVSGQN